MELNRSKIKTLLSFAGIVFLAAAVLAGSLIIKYRQNLVNKAAPTTNLTINPSSQSVNTNESFQFAVTMDTANNHVTGIDMQLKFNPDAISINSVELGSDMVNLNNSIAKEFDNATGTISLVTFTLNKNQAVNGSSLEVLKVYGKVKQDASPGTYTFNFDSSTAISATNETTNALDSTTPGVVIVTIAPQATPTPLPTNGPPNSCGGTCGSDANCQSGLYCYQGYCRNPSCSNSTNCICYSTTTAPTLSPTKKPSSTKAPIATTIPSKAPTAVPNTTPNIIYLTPEPDTVGFWENVYNRNNSEDISPDPNIPETKLPTQKPNNLLPWIAGSLVIATLTLILIIVGVFKLRGIHKSKPPVIRI